LDAILWLSPIETNPRPIQNESIFSASNLCGKWCNQKASNNAEFKSIDSVKWALDDRYSQTSGASDWNRLRMFAIRPAAPKAVG
jgi:hypothetical protein